MIQILIILCALSTPLYSGPSSSPKPVAGSAGAAGSAETVTKKTPPPLPPLPKKQDFAINQASLTELIDHIQEIQYAIRRMLNGQDPSFIKEISQPYTSTGSPLAKAIWYNLPNIAIDIIQAAKKAGINIDKSVSKSATASDLAAKYASANILYFLITEQGSIPTPERGLENITGKDLIYAPLIEATIEVGKKVRMDEEEARGRHQPKSK